MTMADVDALSANAQADSISSRFHEGRRGRFETIWRVVIPSARIGIVIAALFCFILTFGDFVSPLYLGGGLRTMLSTVIIDTVKSGQQWPQAAVVAVTMVLTLLAVALAGIWLAYRRPK
jgi:spermidine/putrescine transport system permease protein/putrescine transport system permease protein